MRFVTPLVTFALGGLLVGATLLAQDHGTGMPAAAPELARLKTYVGSWDAAFKMSMGPQTVTDKGTMTWRMLGDFWLVGDYEGNMMGGPFHGHELTGYDPDKKEHVSYWADSTSSVLTASRGTWDEATKTSTLTSKDRDPATGQMHDTVHKSVVKDADTILYTMTAAGMAEPMMEITYTRRK
jgi:hypothetical protein